MTSSAFVFLLGVLHDVWEELSDLYHDQFVVSIAILDGIILLSYLYEMSSHFAFWCANLYRKNFLRRGIL